MFPYQNKDLTIRERVNDLISRMTLQEKIGQVNQHLYGWQSYYKDSSGINLTNKFKNHVNWGQGLGALYGLFRADPWSKKNYDNGIRANESAHLANMIQSYVISKSRLGIPTLIVEEMPHGHQALDSVTYPTNIGKGNTFDPELLQKSAELQAEELQLKGGNLALVSSLDLLKDPRWGRSEETFGESPYLTGSYTKAIIDGFQGDLISDTNFLDEKVSKNARKHVGVVIKHLIGQGEALGGHNSGTVPMGQREFLEVYGPLIPSLKKAVGVMAAYNDIDGVPCHANRNLLDNLLRKKDGFQGIVMADGTALDRLVDLYSNYSESVFAALNAGVDLSLWDDVYMHIGDAIEKYPQLLLDLNNSVKRVLSIKFLLGLFDDPYVDEDDTNIEEVIHESNDLNLELSSESITLVKNGVPSDKSSSILPLKKGTKLAVIGPHVKNIYHWLGDYTAPQLNSQYISFIGSLREYTSDITYAKGSNIREVAQDKKLINDAVNISSNADAVVLTMGGSSMRNFDMSFLNNGAMSDESILKNTDTGENVDVASLSLGGNQIDLLKALKKTGKPIIVVMIQGRPYDITEIMQLADAVLLAWYPGQQGPKAVSNILFGKTNPNGKLPISYPRNAEQLPVYYYQRRVLKNENYFDETGSPLLRFGYGLSYAFFDYKNLKVNYKDNIARVSVDVKNISNQDGKETILLFSSFFGTDVLPRQKQLMDYKKVFLEPNQIKTIHFKIESDRLLYVDKDMQRKKPKKVKLSVKELSGLIEL
ncbi:glycoside hydrolase family 3 N-terminal domain-containing protein [Companilactobacillus kimchii]|uniref:Glycosyl hydrolase family 3 N terminal domain protein n=3 Tax=Companilactobacillus kimchii TaxID=2801452 RepID=A0ABR5NVW1_9LACO|nr:glycoside hydrolase family 3 N-terminal domain-containing protein [Companilactobacillus kimchii]KAE9559667.1 beta-glucosidase [Companilactobacillus kimchii]KRK53002.1 glycosyl hydrolase family 3 N terminal domain protein [Companilactobacillus kimchii DSM 13961 = JCM 10707]OWF32138.1 Beta-glucosidase [Companilactobacillus kimchii]GEO47915.1 beta-glucosidase [Companilactobacillus paralimentarius]